jgi:hypothetical protein
MFLKEDLTTVVGNLAQVPYVSVKFHHISVDNSIPREDAVAFHDRFNIVLEEQEVFFLLERKSGHPNREDESRHHLKTVR